MSETTLRIIFGSMLLFGLFLAWQILWQRHKAHMPLNQPMSDDWRHRNNKRNNKAA